MLVVLIGAFFYFSGSPAHAEQGKVYVSVSDASASIQEVSDVAMTVDKVELHSASQGWVTVSDADRTFNLLTLKANGRMELAGSADVNADTYDQVRMTINKVEVKTKSAGNKAAVVVAHAMTIPGSVVVNANGTAHVNVDVQTSNSLHTATNGEYVFAPVVVYTTNHGGSVSVASDNTVTAQGGTTDTNTGVGTDLSGNVVVGSQLSPDLKIDVSGETVSAANLQQNGLVQFTVSAEGNAMTSGTTNNSGSSNTSTTGSGSTSGSGSTNTSGSGNTNAQTNTNVQTQSSGSGTVQVNRY